MYKAFNFVLGNQIQRQPVTLMLKTRVRLSLKFVFSTLISYLSAPV